MRRTMFRLASLLGCVALVALFSIIGNAQFRAGVQGVVTDGAGGTVPGATVTLTNKDTNQTQTTTTSDDGFYRFSGLPPGMYSVAVEKADFKKALVDDVKVDAEATKGQDVTLEAGVISEVVTVEADNVGLETEDASVRKTISTEEVLRLPQIGRDPYELVRLAPGVFGAGARSADGSSNGLPNTSGPGGSSIGIFSTENRPPISANGQRVSANSFQIDGVSVNSQTWGGAAVITPTQESVKEVQVTSATYSAEDGRNSGAQIKVVTQNGTNQFHGSAFFKYNDPKWNAFNSGFTIVDPRFTPARVRSVAPQRVEIKDKTFGGSLGGPIYKDKLFFFFAYEGLRTSTNNTVEAFVETEEFRQLVAAARPGSIAAQLVSAPGSEPRIASVLNATCAQFNFPNPNPGIPVRCMDVPGGFDLGSPAGMLGQYVPNNTANWLGGGFDGIPDVQRVLLAAPRNTKGNQYVTRIDFDATSKDKFAFTLFYSPANIFGSDTGAQSRPMADIRSNRLNYNWAFTYLRNFSSNILNEARFNFTKWGFNEVESNPDTNWGIPRVELENFVPGDRLRWGANRSANTPGNFDERSIDFRDILAWVHGNHTTKFGGEYRRDINKNPGTGAQRPIFSHVRWNFFNDTPIFEAITADFDGTPIAAAADFTSGDLAFFVQNDWKVLPNLTINLGLRWEHFQPLKADNLGVLQFGPNGPADGRVVAGENLAGGDHNNFGPQVGFAWSPEMFNQKLVLRGGFGLGYDRLPNALPANARNNPPNGLRYSLCCADQNNPYLGGQILYTLGTSNAVDSFPANPNLGGGMNPNGGPNIGTVEIYGLDAGLRTPQVYRYSLEAQYELPWKLVGTLGYQGSKSEQFVRIEPLHLTLPASMVSSTFVPIFWGFGDVRGHYNGMNARLQRRFANGVQFDLNYKWSKGLDTVSFEAPCGCTNQTYPIDQASEFGRSDFDVRHFTTFVALWDLPFYRKQTSWAGKLLGGWQINTVVTHHTGFPWTPVVGIGLQGGNNRTFSPIRPSGYDGTAPQSNSNSTFLSPGGLFPGSAILNASGTGIANCNAGLGCNTVFFTPVSGNNGLANPPGIGRNTLFGPKYFNIDMSVSKRFGLPNLGVLGERPNLDLRFNFFNAFNIQNIAPFGFNTGSTQIQSATFGEAGSLLAGRVIEFQARFSF